MSETNIMEAIQSRDLALVRQLLASGINPNAVYEQGSALDNAMLVGDDQIVLALLHAGADPRRVSDAGFSPMHLAAEIGNQTMMKLLLDAGAAIDPPDDMGITPLMQTVSNSRTAQEYGYYDRELETLRFLLLNGADPKARDDQGASALIYAVREQDELMARTLLDAGADVNLPENDGWSALMWAARKDNIPIAELLISRGADVNHRSQDGRSAYDVSDSEEMDDFLVAHGASS